jgi:hypothetical protein
MNKQQLLGGLAGTVLTLGVITVASAGDQSWQYDAATDSVSYAFSGPGNRSYGAADYPGNRQAGNQSWQYDASTDTVSYAFSGRDGGSVGQSEVTTKRIAMDDNLPWYYYN